MLLIGGWIAEMFGWRWVFYSISIITLAPFGILLASGIREGDAAIGRRQKFQWSAFRNFLSAEVILLAGAGFVYTISLDGVLTFLSDHLRTIYEAPIGGVGVLVAVSMVGRIIGALSNGWLTDRIGNKQSLIVAIILATIGCLGLAFNLGVGWVGLFAFMFGLAYGYYNSVYAAVAMGMSHPAISASMFAIFMMFVNLGTVGGQSIGGILTESLGFEMMVIIFGLLNLINIPIILTLSRKSARV